jgi:hypothetical protein
MGFNNGGVLEAVERLKKNTGVLEETLVKQTDVKRRCHFGLWNLFWCLVWLRRLFCGECEFA